MHRQWHYSHLPAGFEVFEERLEVRNTDCYTSQILAFCSGVEMWLELEREFGRKRDASAIKVIGCNTGFFLCCTRQHIGYIDSEIAGPLIAGGWWGTVLPQLLYTYVSDYDFVDMRDHGVVMVLFQLVGPAGLRTTYQQTRLQHSYSKEPRYTGMLKAH